MDALISELTMKCVQCGRERKVGMARTEKFCTQRCIINWLEAHPDKNVEDAMGTVKPTVPPTIASIQSLSASPSAASEPKVKRKPVSRALKNLQIDMALPGTKLLLPSGDELSDDEEGGRRSSGDEEGQGRKRAKLAPSTPQMSTITTRATRRSLATAPSPASKSKPDLPATRSGRRSAAQTSGTPSAGSKSTPTTSSGSIKRYLSASVPHPPALKKAKTSGGGSGTPTKQASSTSGSGTPKAVTFNLGFVQNSPDNQSSTATFSLVPIDQLSGSLGGSMLSQLESEAVIPHGN